MDPLDVRYRGPKNVESSEKKLYQSVKGIPVWRPDQDCLSMIP